MNHTVGVCGFGRCGSTMVMTMLVEGGCLPGGDPNPPYEGDFRDGRRLSGRAVKLLDSITYHGLPVAAAWRFVWLDRDPLEQARSQVKFFSAMFPLVPIGEDTVQRFMASYRRDRPKQLAALHGAGKVLVLRYEDILANPFAAALRLREVWPSLDVDAAAAVVHDRDGTCRPDLSVELAISKGSRR